ncbi:MULTISPECIES: GCG_CRPN prefix-to-repeats domain-containing protein [Legionella]|uniref:Transmembrane protein n=1 Tax=Legionella steelei TaxID=947033 RepID=A0A0W0ZDG9_9GAMM|nr:MULTISPECIES: hypothetical protein [Legionella]KTD67245.1 hypothetical protein Lste_3451 [Legionella steelei]MBN9228789.1 hypothetical protein [Legionella steelei]OJW16228.1 MAG: hypothetical protein BGO44_07020 [Legionella sp. 39-23]
MNTSSCISKVLRTGIILGSLFFAVGYTSIATAAQGCGHGYHRNAYGGCVLNAPGPNARPAPYHRGCWRNAWGQLRCYR